MARIVVFGGTGYAGGHIVSQAARRGHEVVAVSRHEPSSLVDGVEYRTTDVRRPESLSTLVDGADVVIVALSPRGDMADAAKFRDTIQLIASSAQAAGVRLGVVGGAGSLLTSEGGPKLVDVVDFPEEYAEEPKILSLVLDDLRDADEALDWFMVSPPAEFNFTNPGEALGHYRVGGDVLLHDDKGQSFISGADFGLAMVDEIEKPAHHRGRFTVAY